MLDLAVKDIATKTVIELLGGEEMPAAVAILRTWETAEIGRRLQMSRG